MVDTIDLNCDMGEGSAADAALMGFITSANVACGVHAGDETTMRETVRLALAYGVRLGAHPSFPDRAGFGRRPVPMSWEGVRDEVAAQVGTLTSIALTAGASLHHVKLHGALYNSAATDRALAAAIGEGVRQVDPSLIIVVLAGSPQVGVLTEMGLRVAEEAFVDRGYTPDGHLVSRGQPGSLVTDPGLAATRAVRLVRDRTLTAADGTELEIRADTLCIHSDTPGAVELARAVRTALQEAGVTVAPLADIMTRPHAAGPRPR